MSKEKNKILKWIIIIAAIVAAGVIVAVLAVSNSPSHRLSKALDFGHRYLESGEYEQAIASFDEALTIDPKCVEAYLGEADAYVALEDNENAIAVLEKGYEETGDSQIKNKLDEFREELFSMTEEIDGKESPKVDETDSMPEGMVLDDFEGQFYFNFASEFGGELSYITYEEKRELYAPWIEKIGKLIDFLKNEEISLTEYADDYDGWCGINLDDTEDVILSCAYSTLAMCYASSGEMEKCKQVRREWADFLQNEEILGKHSIEKVGENAYITTYDQYGRIIEQVNEDTDHLYTYGEKGTSPIHIDAVDGGLKTTEDNIISDDGRVSVHQYNHTIMATGEGAGDISMYKYNYQGNVVSVEMTDMGRDKHESYSFQIDEYGKSIDPEHPF